MPDTYETIQEALDAASDGDTITCTPGKYSIAAPLMFSGKAVTLRADPEAPEGSDTIVVMSQTPVDPQAGSVAVFAHGETASTRMEGFLLTGGTGTDDGDGARNGGAIVCRNGASPVIVDCVISANSAGGGQGGGIYCIDGANPLIENCTLSMNIAQTGGGIAADGAAPQVRGCIITSNHAEAGAGVNFVNKAAASVSRCMITGNYGLFNGGGVNCTDAACSLINCIISGNLTDGTGGALFGWNRAECVVTNCTITGNRAGYENGLSIHTSDLTLINTIVWNHEGGELAHDNSSKVLVSYCCIAGDSVFEGEGTIASDPLLVRQGIYDFSRFAVRTIGGQAYHFPDFVVLDGDIRLVAASPCIDAGISTAAVGEDFFGTVRPQGDGADIGAFESTGPLPDAVFRRGDGNADGIIDLADSIYILSYLFAGGPEPFCMDTFDANDDGSVNLADAVVLLDLLFGASVDLPEPFSACGSDPTPDGLRCYSFPPCMPGF